MQLQLLLLGAGALALPLNDTLLSKRDTHPSIAPYGDAKCQTQIGPSQDFGTDTNNGCIRINYKTNFAGVNWGDWPMGMDSFNAFTDDSCQKYATKTMFEPSGGPDVTGANSCWSIRDHGGPWGSVMQNYD